MALKVTNTHPKKQLTISIKKDGARKVDQTKPTERYTLPPLSTITLPLKRRDEVDVESNLFDYVVYDFISDSIIPPSELSRTVYFTELDWVISGDFYVSNLLHDLDAVAIQLEVYENGNDKVEVASDNFSSNIVQLSVPVMDRPPQLIFSGYATIIKIA